MNLVKQLRISIATPHSKKKQLEKYLSIIQSF